MLAVCLYTVFFPIILLEDSPVLSYYGSQRPTNIFGTLKVLLKHALQLLCQQCYCCSTQSRVLAACLLLLDVQYYLVM